MNEAEVQQRLRLSAAQAGITPWRNQVGACTALDGRLIRFGLCNESAAQNREFKSADLVGIKPVIITQEMVGQLIGQFWARECKRSGWTYTGGAHEAAQARWLELVCNLGGDACFNSTGEI